MYKITKDQISNFMESSYSEYCCIMYSICIPISLSNENSFDKDLIEEIRKTDRLLYYEKFFCRYPMSFFSPVSSVENAQKYCQSVSTKYIQRTKECIDILSKNLSEVQSHEDLQRILSTTETENVVGAFSYLLDQYYERISLDIEEKIKQRNLFIKSSKNINSPAWWSWLDFCIQSSTFLLPLIVKSVFPDIELFVCFSESHSFLSNTKCIKTIREICELEEVSKVKEGYMIFDIIQQTFINNNAKQNFYYYGDLEVLSVKEAIEKYCDNFPDHIDCETMEYIQRYKSLF